MTESADFGIPHDDTEPDDFQGTDTQADVGEPGDLGGEIGVPAPPD